MATVPTYGGAPKVASTPLRAPTAAPANFGAIEARQQQDLGHAVTNLGQVGSNIVTKMQEQENLEAVFRAETTLRNSETEFHNALRERKGTAAKGASKDALKFWDDQYAGISGTLANDPQRQAFDKIYQQRRNSSLGQVAQHESIESRRAMTEAAEASAESTIQNGIANPGAADENADALRRTYQSIGAMNGTPPEKVELDIQKATTKMHAGVVDSLVDRNPGAARAYYNEYKDQILPANRAKIEEALRAGDLKGFSQRKATEIMSKYDDYQEQLDYARQNIKDPDRQAATVAQIKARQAELETNKRVTESAAYDEALRLAVNDPNVKTAADLPMWEQMSGADQARMKSWFTADIEKKLEGRKHDDPEMRRELQDLVNANAIEKEQLGAYAPFLTDSTIKSFETAIDKGKQVSASSLHTEFVRTIARKPESKWSASDYENWDRFQQYAYRTVGDGTYTNKDLNAMAHDFALEMYKPGTGFMGLGRDTATYGEAYLSGEQGEYLVETPEESRAGVQASIKLLGKYGAEVAQGETAEDEFYTRWQLPSAQYLRKNGMPVTPENVAAVIYLTSKKRVVSPETIRKVAGQMQ